VVELRLLGPVEIHTGGRALAIGTPQRSALLAALAVDAARVVVRDKLVDRVWDDAPPARVESAIYAHVAHLRRLLARVNAAENAAVAGLDRRAGGYLLCIEPDSVDLHRFRRLVSAAREPDCSVHDRVRLLRAALGLWRGPALAGLSGGWAARMREAWEHERLAAVVAWAQAELGLGNPDAVLGTLAELVSEYPLAEHVAATLIRALAAAERTTEAVEEYARIRQRLVGEIGAEPGKELQEAYRAVLSGTAAAAPAQVTSTARRAGAAVRATSRPYEAADVAGLRATIAHLVALDIAYGGEGLAEAATQAFADAQRRLAGGGHPASVERDLYAAVAELGEVASWLLYDARQPTRSRQAAVEALLTARLAGDRGMEQFLLSHLSMLDLADGRLGEAVRLADFGLDGAPAGRVAAMFHLRRGRALAAMGRGRDALAAMRRARTFADESVPDQAPDWTWWIHDASLSLHEAVVHTDSGRHHTAVELAQRAVAGLPRRQARDRAIYRGFALRSLVAARAWPDAEDMARELTGEVISPRAAQLLNDVARTATVGGAPRRVVEAIRGSVAA
jgi:DNA-binding SARP family transcriptional activator